MSLMLTEEILFRSMIPSPLVAQLGVQRGL